MKKSRFAESEYQKLRAREAAARKTKTKTKRRKVWVEFDDDGTPDWVTDNKGDTLDGRPRFTFVEHLPGDVVLSQEDAEELRRIVRAYLYYADADRYRALALLRGRR